MPDAPGQREHERREARGEHPFQACQSEGAPAKLFTEHHPDLAEGKKRERARKRESERRWLALRAQQDPGRRENASLRKNGSDVDTRGASRTQGASKEARSTCRPGQYQSGDRWSGEPEHVQEDGGRGRRQRKAQAEKRDRAV